MSMWFFFLHLIFIFVLSLILVCSIPDEYIKCSSLNNTNCTLTNAYGIFPDRSVCKARGVTYPTTEEELISTVAYGTRYEIPMKVATRYAHSIPKLACPRGEEGLIISTKNLNHVVEINVEELTMTVESGATLRQLISEAAKVGLALPYTPYWWGLSLGGLLTTGAHGSTLWGKGSAVHDHVVGLRIVSPGGPEDGYVKVRILSHGDEDLNAATVSLGVLGVISQVTLSLQPMFKRSITYLSKDDSDLGDQVLDFGKQHEFADITWHPSQRRAVYRIDDRVSPNTSGDGLYDSIGFRPTSSLALAVIRTTEENQESMNDAFGKCSSAKLFTSGLLATAYGLTNDGVLFTGYPVIGYQNRIQSSGACLDAPDDAKITACGWDSRIKGEFYHQTAFTISFSVVKNFIQDVQKLVEIAPESLCGTEMYNGFLLRYVTASTAYLGKQDDGVDFDITYYRSRDPMIPRLYEGILEEIEQMAVFKYEALPHWGKNRNVAFDGVIKKYKKGEEFLKVKDVYDPMGLFSNEWTDQVLGLKGEVTIEKEGCGLEGLCICSEDIHCAPSNGYFCRPGKVFRDARVCTP
ncbi:probable L-gulonolactone oxidase 6 [Argentina anserina]|uniref:probable L-gulonolactone oxidase 6 n=1 Tax=Argentina anserina TaxID=57926 RepID=UPI0021764C90|nr:probable L-gulonolactone oxidase 6 [Potentilla anserina]